MKQNAKRKSFIIVVAMLVLLATVLGMSGMTFAKYISTADVPAQNATVAKWGWVVRAESSELFGTNYGDTVTKGLVAVDKTDAAIVVDATTSAGNIVAPGTTGHLYFDIQGSAEVLTKITISIDNASDDGNDVCTSDVYLSDGTNFYRPMKWTLYKSNNPSDLAGNPWTAVSGMANLTLDDMVTKLEGMTTVINPGATNDLVGYYRLTWEWAFETPTTTVLTPDTTDDAAAVLTGDVADTMLGAYTYDSTANALPTGYTASTTVSFNMNITIEQVQSNS